MTALPLTEKLVDERLRTFFYFLTERQNIYWARAEGKPRPWTKDKILDRHFFCNVYRELDRGTQYVIHNIIGDNQQPMWDLLFKVMLYRMFNEPRTYEFLQKPMMGMVFNGRHAAQILDRKRAAGIRIFRGAWMTSGANVVGSKAAAYCMEMERVSYRRQKLWNDFRSKTRMADAWKVICGVNWFGGFSAYQVVLDMSYVAYVKNGWLDYDRWVYPGPGAKLGIMWLCGKNPTRRKGSGSRTFMTEREYALLIYHLRDHQESYFKRFRYKFRRWEDNPLDLHNIEFSLCEFNKYMRAHHGDGKKKRFLPTQEQLPF